MTRDIPWDLEERVEDAFVALLIANVGRAALICAGRSIIEERYPLVLVEAGESQNQNEDSEFNGKRKISVTITMQTEAVNFNEELGTSALVETAREQHRALKSDVIGTVAGAKIHEDLNELQNQGVLFSLAVITAQTNTITDGKITTEQTLEVIANPERI